MDEFLRKVRSRPGLYIVPCDRQYTAGSLFWNFLDSVFQGDAGLWPRQVDLTASGPYFTAAAQGDTVPLGHLKTVPLAQALAVGRDEASGELDGQQLLRRIPPIVWFSEYCLVSVRDDQGTVRQAFLESQPLGGAQIHPPAAVPALPQIAIAFTLPPQIFTSVYFTVAQMRRTLGEWRRVDAIYRKQDKLGPVAVQTAWRVQDDHHFSVRVQQRPLPTRPCNIPPNRNDP